MTLANDVTLLCEEDEEDEDLFIEVRRAKIA